MVALTAKWHSHVSEKHGLSGMCVHRCKEKRGSKTGHCTKDLAVDSDWTSHTAFCDAKKNQILNLDKSVGVGGVNLHWFSPRSVFHGTLRLDDQSMG